MQHKVSVLMRGDDHQLHEVGNAQFNELRGRIVARIDLDASLIGEFHLLGQAIAMNLVEGFKIEPIASDFGIEQIDTLDAVEEALNISDANA